MAAPAGHCLAGREERSERAIELADAPIDCPLRTADVAGKRGLLIDDAMTSGASANACAVALRAAGVVVVLVAARLPDPRLNRVVNAR